MRATIGPRLGRVVVVALLAAGVALLGAPAAQAQAADFSWTSTPSDFSWTSTPDDFSWT